MIKGSNEDKAREIIRMYNQESGRRGTWEAHWQEIADRMYPLASENFQTNFTTKGNKRNQEIYDATAMKSLGRFGAILDSLLTPSNQTWHYLKPSIEELNKDRSVRLWFEDVNRILFKHRYKTTANFAAQNQMNFKSLGAFGSGALYIDPLIDPRGSKGLRYKNCHLGEIYFVENHQGIVDKVLRVFMLTARQATQKWGENVPEQIKTAMTKNEGMEFEFIHCVCPREDIDPGRADFKGMYWASYYVSVVGSQMIEEGGYNSFPYAVSRYEQAPNEVYGRSPAMDALPAIKTLNEQKKTLLKQGHRAVDPVLLVHDDGVLDTFSMLPGAANPGGVSKDGRPLVHTLPVGNVNVGRDLMEDERNDIKDTFLVTLFQILTDNPQMTATEVLERTKEKGILLAPTLGRIQAERLGPQIEREVDILSQVNLLPPMPPLLIEAGGEFEVEYDSPLSRAQRAEEASGLMRTVESAMNVVNATGNPEPLDHFDWDAIVPDLADINAVPVKWRKSKEAIQAIREGRAKQQQTEQALQAAPSVAAVAKATGTPGATQ